MLAVHFNLHKQFLEAMAHEFDWEIKSEPESYSVVLQDSYVSIDIELRYSESWGSGAIITIGHDKKKLEYYSSTERLIKETVDYIRKHPTYIMQTQFRRIQKQLETLQETMNTLLYAPGGPMYKEAEQSFTSLQN
nr:hypothetical protein K-LCC10_0301 [Kaumoebavirus]